ncbi:MAG: protein translocase subunit SecF [Gammaproteobacteria bacterium]|nr:protein translocase subunit SecF [Gammaproteobacteria bacterium]
MEFFKHKTTIDFMGLRKWSAMLSLILFMVSLTVLFVNKLNFGLDFTGGTQIQLAFPTAVEVDVVRQHLTRAGFQEAVVQNYGATNEVLISLGVHTQDQMQLTQQLLAVLPNAQVKQMEFVGSQVGSELATKGALAIVVALLSIMAYIAFRFEYRFAIGAAVALIHDPVLILGFFSFFHLEFNLTVLAAILAVIGYSLNDTIVIFDRVRENFRRVRKGSPLEIMNLSINQTLSRTIMTSAMTLVVVLALFFFGPPMIHHFAIALIIGILVGTYSSIYVAGALAVALGLTRGDLLKKLQAQPVDDRP